MPIAPTHLTNSAPFVPIGDAILRFWMIPAHRDTAIWAAHRDINDVMLATSLMPDGYLADTELQDD
ncbi:MAG: hypothetical protein ACYS0D_14150 [Planctomycetota bacterium]